MSYQSQQHNMERLSFLLSQDLSYIPGERENGPNGAKKTFLNIGKVFLRALAKDLGLRDVKVISNAGGIAVSGECNLYGMWQTNGLFLTIEQPGCGDSVILYRSIRDLNDHKGDYNRHIRLQELKHLTYGELLSRLSQLNRGERTYERAA